MIKVYRFDYIDAWASGLTIIAAETLLEALDFMKKYDSDLCWQFKEELNYTVIGEKGVIASDWFSL